MIEIEDIPITSESRPQGSDSLLTPMGYRSFLQIPPADHLRIADLETALRGIQEMASEDLRLGEHPLRTSLHQIEADARAALNCGTLLADFKHEMELETIPQIVAELEHNADWR